MPKKQQRNAYYFYMLDYIAQEEKETKVRMSLKDASIAASDGWKALTANMRQKYEQAAKEYKDQQKANPSNKYTSLGETYEQVEQQMKEEQRLKEKEKKDILNLVKLKAFNDSILTEPFYLIDVNYYCRTNDGVYVPCEIAFIAFTLQDGIVNEHQIFIDPVDIPMGYRSEAKESMKYHEIPLPPYEYGEKDYLLILTILIDFLRYDKDIDELPPVFTMPNKIEAVKSVLEQICDRCGQEPSLFRVYHLDQLFYVMKNALSTSDDTKFPRETLALAQLKKVNFEYDLKLACKTHQECDLFNHCVLLRVKNWGFTILDHCCQLVGVELEPGKHVPNKVNVKGAEFLKSTSSNDTEFDRYSAFGPHKSSISKHEELPLRKPNGLSAFLAPTISSDAPKVKIGVGRGKGGRRWETTRTLTEGVKDLNLE